MRFVMKLFSIIGFMSIAFPTNCQDSSLKGRVVDQKSKEPLPYANISIQNSSLGTVSNELGEFIFFVPTDLANDTLIVSYIGYKTFKDKISNLQQITIFTLEESPILLNEITVSSEGARKLIKEALKAIPLVYPTMPYLMEGFHRSWEKIDFTDSIRYPGTLIEAAVTIYDPGYGQKKVGKAKEETYINEIRRSEIMDGWNYGRGNGLSDLLAKNLVKYNHASPFIFLKSFLDMPNTLIYEWEGSTALNGENLSIVKIEATNKMKFPAFYKVYISELDHAILRYELYGIKKEIDYSLGEWYTESLIETYIFKRYQGAPCLSYAKIKYTIKNLDTTKKKVIRTEDYFREVLVNNVITTNVDEKRKSLISKKSKDVSLALQAKGYNAAFWENYNVIKENPLDKEIIQYFDQKVKSKRKK